MSRVVIVERQVRHPIRVVQGVLYLDCGGHLWIIDRLTIHQNQDWFEVLRAWQLFMVD